MTRASDPEHAPASTPRPPRSKASGFSKPRTIDELLARQREQDLLRFIICGSVDDGKSTLIGRLLWEAQHVLDDQFADLQSQSRKYGTQGEEIDFARFIDGLSAEREQGITIDVAYRYFATAKRKFIVADCPGHEQYTRNMATGASTADVAVLLVDAQKGMLTQSRRHALITSVMGIKHVVLAVNKMDLVGYDSEVFTRIRQTFESFATRLDYTSITAIPISALKGDNVTERSPNMPWYQGATLLEYLDDIVLESRDPASEGMAFPVQWVNRPHADFRGLSGTVARGTLKAGEEIRVTASGRTAIVSEIVTMDGHFEEAHAGDAVTLCLDRDIDASRGDVITSAGRPLELTDQFMATVVWMHEEDGLIGRNYDLALAGQWTSASITGIKHRIDVGTLAHEAARTLRFNDIAVCNVATAKPIAFDSYSNSRTLGGFILVDRFTHATVGAGMIHFSLRRSRNVHEQALSITRMDRERLNGHPGKVIWFTGLSGSGKSTLANALEVELHGRGIRTYILDGDNVRRGLNKDLGFTDADRVENIRRVAEIARLMMDAGLVVITAFISPFEREREMARELIGAERFVEVYLSTPLEVCEQRDVKGLYKQARAGKIPNMTGLNSPYEPPDNPSLTIDAASTSVASGKQQLLDLILGERPAHPGE
jgi:bifunctional enzyme CysN/CysC